MKRLIRIVALILALLLLTGCDNVSDPEEARLRTNEETTFSPEVTDPALPVATEPPIAETVPTETNTTDPPVAPTPESAGFGDVYADICLLMETGSWDLEYTYVSIGMIEVVTPQSTKEERYNSITYALEDINNDDVPEMIVLDALGNTRILAVFEIQDGQPVMTHEGWYRSRLYRLSDGAFYLEGSGGAAYSIFEAYGHCWFTYPKDEEMQEIGFYYAADGSYDPSLAQEITAAEYEAQQVELAKMITDFSAYPFR